MYFFYIHNAIIYRRWFWSLRDSCSFLCQILIPATYAAVGLGIFKNVFEFVQDGLLLTKHQQSVCGLNLVSYWIGNFISDCIAGIPAGALVIILVLAFDTTSSEESAMGPFILTILAFIWSIMSFTYLLSFVFNDASSGQRRVAILYLKLGLPLLTMSFLLDFI